VFEHAFARVVAVAAASAAAVMAVFAAGFALYALIAPAVGAPGAAAIVALVAALVVALFALFTALRARRRERAEAEAQQHLLTNLPAELGDLVRDRPMASLAVTLIGGIVAARHPALARDLIALAARFTRGR
jgi:hypothetical protein